MESFSRADVAKHNTAADAFIIVNDAVYNVSKFAALHPGGEKLLLAFAGTDATDDFYTMHRQSVLDQFGPRLRVGTLSDGDAKRQTAPDDGLTEWGRLSSVPYAEAPYWRGWKSPYHNESHYKFRLYVREFYDKHIREVALRSETSNEPATLELMQKISKAGLLHTQLGAGPHLSLLPMPMGMSVDEFDGFHANILRTESARVGTPGFHDSVFSGFTIGAPPILHYGTPAMKEQILPQLMRGEKRICLAITEPHAGSDVAGLRTTAELTPDGKHYVVNGAKKWITNGTFADYFVTAVRTGGPGAGGISMLLIERSPGLETKIIKTDYSHAAGTSYVTFEDVMVPAENIMGEVNNGFANIVGNFNKERLAICEGSVASSRCVIDECLRWANQRLAFGKPLIQQPVIREKLGRMIASVEAASASVEFLLYQMEQMTYEEENKYLGGPIALLKYHCTRVATMVADQSIQIFGGRGVTKGGMGRFVNTFNATYKLPSVYGGSEELMVDLGVRQAMKHFPRDAKL